MAKTAVEKTPTLSTPGKLLTAAEVVNLAEFAAKRAENIGTVIDDLEAGIARQGEDAAVSAAAAGFSPEDQKSAAKKVAAKARTETAANSEDVRWSYLRELNAAAGSLSLMATLYSSPQAVLARTGLGTSERTNFQQQLTNSGNQELRNMAAFSVATENKVLGSAIAAVVERMPRRERPLSTAELAEQLVGKETRAVQDAIAKVKLATQTAINVNREFEAGRRDPLARVKLALDAKEEA